MRGYKIIIILANEIPYISKAVSTLLVLGEYIFLNLDKGQLCQADEILGCQVVEKIRHWNLEGPLNGGLILLDGGSIGQV